MATTSVLKSSATALLALMLGTASLIPAASAQERGDRGERGSGRMERQYQPSSQPSMPRMERPVQSQAPSWQGRAPSASSQPSWQGRPTFSPNMAQGSQAPRPSRPSTSGSSWNDSAGNGGRPSWSQGNQTSQGGRPSWQGGRNPTYTDPSRGNAGNTPGNTPNANNGRPADGRGMAWNQNRQGQWYHTENGQWRQNSNGQWTSNNSRSNNWNRDRDRDRDGNRNWGHDRDRNWDRDRDRDGNRNWDRNNRWRGNNGWGYSNGWNNNRWGYNNNWRSWDRDHWRRDNRYDWYGWRNRHRSVFSLGFYYAPWQDYSYSRFGIGVTIGQPFYDQRYWIADPWAYRLPPADGPYRWVRYYNDALLIDLYSGEVVDAVYDIFY